MPIVPRINPAPLPGVRIGGGAPDAAFGGGGGNASAGIMPGLSAVHNQAAQIAQEEKVKADQIAITGAGAGLTAIGTDALYGPDGALNKKGQDAFTAPETTRANFFMRVGQIRAGLGNDDQRDAFDRMVTNQWGEVDRQVQRHVAQQRQAFDDGNTDAAIANLKNQAINGYSDPTVVTNSIDQIKANATAYGARNGWSNDQIQELAAKQVSDTHYGVLSRMLDTKQDVAAASYFQAHRDELVGKQLTDAERFVVAGSLDGEALRRANDIIGSSATPTEMFKQVDAIADDARLHDKVRGYVRDHIEDVSTARAQERAARMTSLEQALGQNGGRYDQLPLTELHQLEAKDQVSLQETAEKIRHPKTETNLSVLTHLVNLSALNDATRAKFNAMDLSQFRNQLSEEDYTRLLYAQRSARLGEDRATDAATRRVEQREETTVIKTADQARKVDQGSQLLRDRLKAQGKSDADINKILPPSKAPSVVVPKWMTDSAATDPEYASYLRSHSVPIAQPAAASSTSSGQPLPDALNPNISPFSMTPAPQRPRVAGAPLPARSTLTPSAPAASPQHLAHELPPMVTTAHRRSAFNPGAFGLSSQQHPPKP